MSKIKPSQLPSTEVTIEMVAGACGRHILGPVTFEDIVQTVVDDLGDCIEVTIGDRTGNLFDWHEWVEEAGGDVHVA
jgi:hypothetical protein